MDQISRGWGLFSPRFLLFFSPIKWLPNYYWSNKTCSVVLSMSPFSVWGFRLPKEKPLVPVRQSVQSLIHSYSIIRLIFFWLCTIFALGQLVCLNTNLRKGYQLLEIQRWRAITSSLLFILVFVFCFYSPCDGSSGCHMLLCSFHVTL